MGWVERRQQREGYGGSCAGAVVQINMEDVYRHPSGACTPRGKSRNRMLVITSFARGERVVRRGARPR